MIRTALVILIIFVNKCCEAQYNDKLIFNTGDTIACEITLVNDQNVFYKYQSKKKVIATYTSRQEIKKIIQDSLILEESEFVSEVKFTETKGEELVRESVQNNNIIIEKSKYYYHGEKIGRKRLKMLLRSSTESYKILRRAQPLFITANVLESIGGILW